MATPDVSVHMEEVVVVTTPDNVVDGSGVEEVKTVLVTTNLSQHSSDLNEDTLETENAAAAAAAAFTASAHLKEALLVKMAEGDDCVEAEIVYPITCGDSKANLIWRKFVCPGINVKCVQYDNHLISPKEFVHLAGKSTLKDWKRAIRMNGIMLRKIMDSGKLDFYEHTKVCSNTCRSTKIDLTGARVSLTSQTSTEYIPLTPASADETVVANCKATLPPAEKLAEHSRRRARRTAGDPADRLVARSSSQMRDLISHLEREGREYREYRRRENQRLVDERASRDQERLTSCIETQTALLATMVQHVTRQGSSGRRAVRAQPLGNMSLSQVQGAEVDIGSPEPSSLDGREAPATSSGVTPQSRPIAGSHKGKAARKTKRPTPYSS